MGKESTRISGWERYDKLEAPKSTVGRETSNVYRVDAKTWGRWGQVARGQFNQLYGLMAGNMSFFVHPKFPMKFVSRFIWKTTAYNAAYMAAEFINNYFIEIENDWKDILEKNPK